MARNEPAKVRGAWGGGSRLARSLASAVPDSTILSTARAVPPLDSTPPRTYEDAVPYVLECLVGANLEKAEPRPFLFTADVDAFFLGVHGATTFLFRFVRTLFHRPLELKEVLRQCYEVGCRSLPLITLTGFVTGIVFTKQSRPSLAAFGASSWLPSLITIALVRALAPLVTALICAGKVGSNIGAELGSMRVTEQIDAMEVSAVDPMKFLVVTRVIATTLMVPVLMLYCAMIGLLGSYVDVHAHELTSLRTFFDGGFQEISFLDVGSSITKSIIFGFTIGITATYKGFMATNGTEGVGRAANAAVVFSMFAIFIEEVIIVQIIGWIRSW
jgi:phospholipid/cholesterol/gamma-HCH transport system permease protein